MDDPFLLEGEEGDMADGTVTLSEIVEGREMSLAEEQVWALCRECCLTLEYVHNTEDLFQSLVITPDTVAFDREGNVCFLDLDADPDPLYLAPDKAEEGITYKSHLYSLGMTLLFAVDYMGHSVDLRSEVSDDLYNLLTQLTQDDPGKRPKLETVLQLCDHALQDYSSQEICQKFACNNTEQCLEGENNTSLLSVTEELAAYLQNQTGLVTPGQGQSSNSDSGREHLSSSSSVAKISHNLLHDNPDRWMEVEMLDVDEQERDEYMVNSIAGHSSHTSIIQDQSSTSTDSIASPRKKRRQGLLLSEILTFLERNLQESELWALCKECIISLQRKKKHLPAYISPDTVMVQANGCVSYKAIPEDKPLEIIFMAPELQQKGIVDEKTCMFGLGITLSSAAGKKTFSPNATTVTAFEELLTSLLDSSPEYRPTLDVGLLACDEYEKQTSIDSRALCQKLFLNSFALKMSHEKETTNLASADYQKHGSPTTAEIKNAGATDLKHYEVMFSEDDMEENELASVSQPSAFRHLSQEVPSGSAFRLVPVQKLQKRLEERHGEQLRIPNAFSSAATHFKPIILHSSTASEVTSKAQILEHAEGEEKKTVVNKLKELKESMQKSRQGLSMSKDTDCDHSKPETSDSGKTQTPGGSGNSSRNLKSEQVEETSVTLESVLQEFQSSGQVDTQSLALAIAEHLKVHLSGKETGDRTSTIRKKKSPGHRTSTEISGDLDQPSAQFQPQQVQQHGQSLCYSHLPVLPVQPQESVQTLYQQATGTLSSSNVGISPVNPTSGFIGQPMPFSFVQYPGGLIPGAPVQFHMQQDPRTGLVQLVPISVMSHSCSHSQPTTPCSACTPNSESGLVQGLQHQFFHVSPNTVPLLDAPSVDLSGQDSGKGKDEVSSNRFMTTNSRSAKGLVHKTAAQHTKHCASGLATSLNSISNVIKTYSNSPEPHCTTDFLDKESFAISDSPTGFGIGHGRVNNSGSGVPSRNSGSYTVQDQGSRGSSRQMYVHDEAIVRSHHDSDRAQDDGKPQHTSSHLQPLTPPLKGGDVSSPDKLTTFQGAEVGLMDGMQYGNNLQHNAAYTQVQQTLQDGGIIVGPVPDKEVMTDYVLSLAHLTWETFKNAVLEKYPHIQWQNNLLARLFHVVNGDWPPADRDPAKTLPVEGRKAFINEEQNTLGKKTKLYSGQLDSLPSAPKGNDPKEETHHSHVRPEQFSQAVEKEPQMRTKTDIDDKENLVKDSGIRTAGFSNSLVRVLPSGRYGSGPSETSDSTDSEDQGTKMRAKKRLDSYKSNSLHNLQGSTTPNNPISLGSFKNILGTSVNKSMDSSNVAQSKERNCQERPSQGQYKEKQETGNSSHDVDGYSSGSQSPSSYIPSSYHSLPRPQHSSHAKAMHFYSTDDWKGSKNLQLCDRPSQSASKVSMPRHYHHPDGNPNSVSIDFKKLYKHERGVFSQQSVEEQKVLYSSRTNSSLYCSSPSSFTGHIAKAGTGLTGSNKVFTQASKQMLNQQEVNNNSCYRIKPSVPDLVRPSGNHSSSSSSCKLPQTQHAPKLAWGHELGEYYKKGQVVYHCAMLHFNMTEEMDRFIHGILEKEKKSGIEASLANIEQEIAMHRKQRRKCQGFYKKLTDPGAKHSKGDRKAVVSQVLKDMSEMTKKLHFLDLCQTHLQMLLAELYGLDFCFLHTLVASGGSAGVGDPPALVLQPYLENHLLQFQTVREPTTGCDMQVLQAGHPKGLLAYLFTRSALSEGFIHQFLFCFRYFLRAEEVFDFIVQKYLAAAKGNQKDANMVRVQQRAMDLLQYWLEGYYSVDFERNESLQDHLEKFVTQRVESGVEGAQNLLNLLYACHLGENVELTGPSNPMDYQDEVYYLHLASPKRQTKAERLMEVISQKYHKPKEQKALLFHDNSSKALRSHWESFSSLLGRKKTNHGEPGGGTGMPFKGDGGLMIERRPASRAEDGTMLSVSKRRDAMQLMDYAAHRLAEQLTLMEQELFQRTHPVHYLDSKAKGIGVDLSIPTLLTPSVTRKATKSGQSSLFVSTQYFESRVDDMIAHAKEITHWVSAEVLACGSQKGQETVLLKFLKTAHLCIEIHNYATALAIFAGLDNLLVRQLPTWRFLSAKSAAVMEELEQLQVKMKGDSMALMNEKNSHTYPTIPCILFFVLHLQQLEIGGFRLANGMYKWSKMRSICQFVDQIRIFREHEYGFEPDYELQSLIRRRLHELSTKDLHTVAATYGDSFRRQMSTAAGLQSTFRRVLAKLQNKSK